MITLEKVRERKLKKQVEKLGGLCLKFVSPGTTGVPDRKILMPFGLEYFVELKKDGETLSPRQVFMKKQFEKRGTKVYVVDSNHAYTKFIEKIIKDQKNYEV